VVCETNLTQVINQINNYFTSKTNKSINATFYVIKLKNIRWIGVWECCIFFNLIWIYQI